MPKKFNLGKALYSIGVALAIVLFLGNMMVVELDAALTPPLYFVLAFGYIFGFLMALIGAVLSKPSNETGSHSWKLGVGVVFALIIIRQVFMIFRLNDSTVQSEPRFFGILAFCIVVLLLTIIGVLARKLPGKSAIARWGVELQMASFVFFALAATLTCSLGALSADTDGLAMTHKVIAMKNETISVATQAITKRSYGAMISYQVICSWVVALITFLVGSIWEQKTEQRNC